MGTSRSLRRYSGRRNKKLEEKQQIASHENQITKGSNPLAQDLELKERKWRFRFDTVHSVLRLVREFARTIVVVIVSIDGVRALLLQKTPETLQVVSALIRHFP